jgi:hypothetical protein
LVVCVSCLSGCMDEKSKFIGTWQSADGHTTITFNTEDTAVIVGTGPFGMAGLVGTFNYSVANQKITFSSGSIGETLNYSFPQSNQLILSSDAGVSLVLTKS